MAKKSSALNATKKAGSNVQKAKGWKVGTVQK